MEKVFEAEQTWRKEVYEPWIKERPERKQKFETASGIELKPVYTPYDVKHIDYLEDLNLPGCFPFTRGIYPSMYRGKLWTIREFSGFGTPEDTNKRLKFLLEHGETGLSIAFDMPTLYGYDADSPRAFGEVGKMGVSVSSLKDMEILFEGIPLDQVTTSMTINAPAIVLLAFYIAVAEKQGVPLHKLSGTIQNDMLKEYIAQKEWIYPPEAHLRIIRDIMEFCTKNMPKWNYISISGYHIREAGASAIQELAFTLMDGFTYVELGISAGLDPNEFATRLSFFFNSTMDFFEEIAKFRAARRIWATVLKERYGVKNPRALLLRFHTQTSGASLTWQQPLNNIVRTAIEALAAVLGGTQSLHTNSYDEALCLPTEEAVVVAVRTQQIIAHETNVDAVIDPLAGSYYVEWLTDKLEEEAYKYFDKIEELGGMVEAIKKGYPQKEIIENAYRQAMKVENKESIIVGVNEYIAKDEKIVNIFRTDPEVERKQRERLEKLKQSRDNKKVKEALEEVRRAFEDPSINLMYPILKAVKAYATLQEIMDIGREVYGTWKEPSIL
ncbi:MAG: methylmalonyl-CoA mutase family protein [Thermoproteota archaeon]|nr:methylmalonyl-CoA mutase family protein [Thermoproteota archaeon]